MVPNKSHTEFHIPDINPELIRHFIRGYFDGNGTVFLQSKSQSVRIGFYSNETLLKDIQLQLNKSIKTPINKIYKKLDVIYCHMPEKTIFIIFIIIFMMMPTSI